MNTTFHLLRSLGIGLGIVTVGLPAFGAGLKQATVTQTYNEVKVVAPSRDDRAASPGERIAGDTGLRTGQLSRAELEFQDKTLTRLGANTIFNFANGTRDLALEQGTMLLQVPKGAGGAKIRTAAITAAITGTSILLEYTPDFNPPPGSTKKKRKGYVKVIVLEGTLRLYLNNRMGESVLLEAGQMLITSPDTLQLPQSVDVNIARLVETSILVNNRYWQQGRDPATGRTTRAVGQSGALSMPLIDAEIARQQALIAKGSLLETNLGITGRGTLVMIKSDDILQQIDTRTTVAQSQLPGSGPKPAPVNAGDFTVDAGTTIKTAPAPTITNAATTGQGGTYRGVASDGPFSTYVFGSTSAFDTTAGFNGSFFGSGSFPPTGVAVFRFAGMLTLAGNPILNLVGGSTSLALVGGTGLITATTPFTFSLSGLNELLLATETGPLTIGPGVSFSGTNTRLDLYARGATSDLTFNGTASLGSGIFFGAAQRDIQLNGVINSASLSLISGGSVFLNDRVATGAVTVTAGQDIVFQSGAAIQGSGPLSLTAGRDILATGGSIRTPDPNITITAARDLTAGFFGGKTFTIGRNISLSNSFSFETATAGGSVSARVIQPFLTPTNTQSIFQLSAATMTIGAITFNTLALTQAAPTLTLTAAGAVNVTGSIFVGTFDGGSLVISAATDVTLGNANSFLDLSGHDATTAAGNGGRGGNFTATLSGLFTLNSFAALNGGDAIATGSGAGGSGGNFTVTAGSINLASGISVLGGAGGNPALGGASGSVTLRSTAGDITLGQPILYDFSSGSVTINSARDVIFNGASGTLTINAFVTAGRDITSAGDLLLQDATAGNNISAAGQIAANNLTAGMFVFADQIFFNQINAGAAVIATTLGPNYINILTPAEVPLVDPNNLPNQKSITAPGGVTVTNLDFGAYLGTPMQLTINSPGSVVGFNTGTETFDGCQAADGTPGIGGNLIINTAVMLVMPETLFTLRGADSGNALFGGAAGGRLTFNLTQASPLMLQRDGTIIDVSGGAALPGGSLAGGNGGRVAISNTGDITINGDIDASTGLNGMGVAFGGSGGIVNLASSSGVVTVSGVILASKSGSQNGGVINLTSGLTSGDAILLNGSLRAPINDLSTGTLGLITVQSGGGDIRLANGATIGMPGLLNANVAITVLGAAGQILVDNSSIFGNATLTAPGLSGSGSLVGDQINMNIGAGGVSVMGNLIAGIGNITSLGSIASLFDLTAGSLTTTGVGSNISAGGALTINGGSINTPGNLTVGQAIDMQQFPNGTFGNINVGGNISAAGGIFTPGDPAVVSAGGSISAPGILTGTLTAGSDITIDNTAGNFGFGIVANTITAGGTVLMINSPTISPNNAGTSGVIGFTPVDFTLTALSIVSGGSTIPVILSLGSDAGAFGIDNPGNGGNIAVNVTNGLSIGPGGNLAAINSYGGMLGPLSAAGGDGGTVTITTPGGFQMLNGGEINASSGIIPTPTPTTIGAGGTVTVNAGDFVDIAGAIRVSHDDPVSGPGRRSSSGGNINIKSTKVGGIAIQIQSTAQLLSLLNAAAPGPGGKITIVASGAGSNIRVQGKAQADRGTVEVRHDGTNGTISTAATTDLRGDIVKIGALGNNGILTIGGGLIDANNTIKLYATGTSGLVQFVANTSLNSGSLIAIAGRTVTINNGVQVNVTGAGGAAQVYTNTPNYFGSGGNGSTTGVFTGNGAQTNPFGGQPGF